MTTLRGLAILLLGVSLTGCAFMNPGIPGSGKIVAQAVDVGEFQGVSFYGGGKLTVTAGAETSSCEIEVDDNLLEHIETKVENGILTIRPKVNIAPSRTMVVRISSKSLSSLSVAGSCDAELTGLNGEKLDLNISGSGDISCTGDVESLSFSLAGSGSLDAEKLNCKSAEIAISGSGEATVNATDSLTAAIAGSGDVRYLGTPNVSEQISGSGSVKPLAQSKN
jgi:hypothetical protein